MKAGTVFKVVLFVILPLLAGLLIYIFYRDNTWLHQHMFIGTGPKLDKPPGLAGHIVVYTLPDFCWCFSFASSLILLKQWLGIRSDYFNIEVLLLLICSELVQLLFPAHFTFDSWDIGAAVLAFLLSVLLLKPQNEQV